MNEEIITAIITAFAKQIPDALVRFFKVKITPEYSLDEFLGGHLSWVNSWSNEIQLYGMSNPQNTDDSTISLRLASIPRKFQGSNKVKELFEVELLEKPIHYMLLGDPGAGKTTTLKRLARRMLTEEEVSDRDYFQYPIVIRFRDLKSNLIEHIADILGIRYEYKEISRSIKMLAEGKRKRKRVKDIIQKVIEPFCESTPLYKVVIDILSATKPLLLLDGLDEVLTERLVTLQNEIANLALASKNYKMIVSCRSGEYSRHVEGLSVIEMCPLYRKEIEQIAKHWLADPLEFLSGLENVPFYDLANRPLFLMQLIIFFKRFGYLPERPADVYSKIVNLLLEDWDSQRGIHRKSKYSSFTPMRKTEFLAALAYRITYEIKEKVFNTSTLVSVYKKICSVFGLPSEEALEVAREIETHTGIIIQGSGDMYEFSHLSLQEYLCASYLCRAPLAEHLADYLATYPAPLAVMVAISAEPGNTLAALLLSPESYRVFYGCNSQIMERFVSRLEQEKPYFSRSKYLGLAMLRLIFFESTHISEWVFNLVHSNIQVRQSLCDALEHYRYTINNSRENSYTLILYGYFDPSRDYKICAPDKGNIPIDIMQFLIKWKGFGIDPFPK